MVLSEEEKREAEEIVKTWLPQYPEEIAFLKTELTPEEIDEIVYKTVKNISPKISVDLMRKCNEQAEAMRITWEDAVKRQQAVSLCMFIAGRFAGGEKP